MVSSRSDILGLDIGSKRIGIARVSPIARIPEPLKIIPAGDASLKSIKDTCTEFRSNTIVAGVPHNMSGEQTQQSKDILAYIEQLKVYLGPAFTVQTVDESLSSVTARSRNKTAKHIDDIAAAVILENYLEEHV